MSCEIIVDLLCFIPVQDGGRQKRPPPTSVFPITSKNLSINPPL